MIYTAQFDKYHGIFWKKIIPSNTQYSDLTAILKNISAEVVENNKKDRGIRLLCYDKEFADEFLHEFTSDFDAELENDMKLLHLEAREFVKKKKISFVDVWIFNQFYNKNSKYAHAKIVGNNKKFSNHLVNELNTKSPGVGDFIYSKESYAILENLANILIEYKSKFDKPIDFITSDLIGFYLKSIDDADEFLNGGKL